MKNLVKIITSIIIILSFTSCEKGPVWGIKGQGQYVTETRNVTDFSKIELCISGEIKYVQDSSYYVEVSAQQNILDVLTTEVHGNTLEIDFDKRVRKHDGVTVIIHSPNITGIKISGSGNILVMDSLSTTDIELDVCGSGNITVPKVNTQYIDMNVSGSGNISVTTLDANYLNANITGSGNIDAITGSLASQTLNISGSGNINLLNIISNTATAKITGSGDISVYVTQTLNATITGSGDIRYKGSPVVNANITGSGTIQHVY
jgi:Putative auto-transporter adhesin, head GIN domain